MDLELSDELSDVVASGETPWDTSTEFLGRRFTSVFGSSR